MKKWYSRPVFFVKDAESSLAFYRDKLGFSLNWNYQENDRAFICQIHRDGLELILNQDPLRAGHGRVFIALDHEQENTLREEIKEKQISASESWWGMPIIVILDLDENQLFFSPPEKKDQTS